MSERSERSHPASDLDLRLAGIDRRLREVEALLMPDHANLCLGAGPFASTEAVRGFERALSAMPGVSEVTLLGFKGAARAVFDVQLS